LKDFKAKKISEEKVILEASKLVVGNLFEIDTTENSFDDD
jgi:hypothetical protein